MGHSQFKFKSSGVRKTDHRFTKKSTSPDRPIGFKTPLTLGDDLFKMHTSPIRQLSDNFRNLIMTNQGERLGMFNFGANLNAIVFEYSNSPNFEQLVGEAITNVTQKYIPSITIVDIQSAFVDKVEKNDANRIGLAKVRIRIEYIVPKFKSPKLALEVDLNIGG
tara:strand:+ start:38 stop:529 length:492 start_codon:yes stop_codon:yes gene_type:complete